MAYYQPVLPLLGKCERIASCYGGNAQDAVGGAIRARHSHHGYMADFDLAHALVRRTIETGEEATPWQLIPLDSWLRHCIGLIKKKTLLGDEAE